MNETSTAPLRILIADDHDLMREGARAVIQRHPGWEVCAVACDGREAVSRATELKPDIVVIDMSMPGLNGLDAAIQIKRKLPAIEILMLTAHESDDLIRKAFEAGLKSFLFKNEAHQLLVEAIESLAQHKPYFTAKVSDALFSKILNRAEGRRDDAPPGERLTIREREVVQLLAEGKSNRDVAETLRVSVRTAETHRATILRKLKLDSVADLVRYAIRNKMIEA